MVGFDYTSFHYNEYITRNAATRNEKNKMENNYFALLANDVKKLWNGLDDGQKLGMLALIVITIISATFFLSKAMEPDWVVLYSDLNEVNALTIVENMKKNGYQYKVSEDRKSILVPSNVSQFSRRCVLGIGVKPLVSSAWDLVALINRM